MIYVNKFLKESVKSSLEYSASSLTYSIHQSSAVISFSDLKRRSDFDDFTYYTIAIDRGPSPTAPGYEVVNFYLASSLLKARPGLVASQLNRSLLVHIFVPHKGVQSFDECEIIIFATQTFATVADYTPIVPGSNFSIAETDP